MASVMHLRRLCLFVVAFISAVADLSLAAPSTKQAESGGNFTIYTHEKIVIQVEDTKDNHSTCTMDYAQIFSGEFHGCFKLIKNKKYGDSGKDLDNIIHRILEHSRVCTENVTKECRPSYDVFMVMIDKVISEIKGYYYRNLELKTRGENKIKDLECVEKSLSNETYQSCFKEVFAEETYASEEKFQQKVEKAISCSNKSHKLCSETVKTSLNRIVRTILGVKQPENEGTNNDVLQPEKDDIKDKVKPPEKEDKNDDVKQPEKKDKNDDVKQPEKDDVKDGIKQQERENIKDGVKHPKKEDKNDDRKDDVKQSEKEDTKDAVKQAHPIVIKHDAPQPIAISIEHHNVKPEPQKRWYDYIIQPFVSIWRGIKWLFGF